MFVFKVGVLFKMMCGNDIELKRIYLDMIGFLCKTHTAIPDISKTSMKQKGAGSAPPLNVNCVQEQSS